MKATIISLIVIAVAMLFFCVGYVLQYDPGVPWTSFEPGFGGALYESNFRIVGEMSPGENIPVPMAVRWHPGQWHSGRHGSTGSGPDGVILYQLYRTDPPAIDCLVRYLDDKACVIELRGHSGQEGKVADLRQALQRRFPKLLIRVRMH